MRPVDSTELSNRGLNVLVDRPLGDIEDFPNFPGRLALRHPSQNLALTRGERSCARLSSTNQDVFIRSEGYERE